VSHLRRSLWHWDLWAAIAGGTAAAVFWALTDHEPGWGSFGTVIALSVAMAGLAWQQWSSIRSLLKGPYGELVRLTDRHETKVKLPYFATIVVAIVSAIWSGGTAAAIRILDSKWAEVPLLGVAGFLVAWSCLGMLTLVGHSWRHNKMRAELEAIHEETAAAQLRHKTEQQRARRAKMTE